MSAWISSLSAGFWIAIGLGSGLTLLMIFVLVASKTAAGDAQLASPIAGAGIVLLGLLAGLVVDAHSGSFTGAPILRYLKDDAPATLSVFLLLAGGALLLASAYYRAADRIRKREIDTLVQKSDELARTLRTLPPESFSQHLRGFLCRCIRGVRGCSRQTQPRSHAPVHPASAPDARESGPAILSRKGIRQLLRPRSHVL